jgi:hypothetical protein
MQVGGVRKGEVVHPAAEFWGRCWVPSPGERKLDSWSAKCLAHPGVGLRLAGGGPAVLGVPPLATSNKTPQLPLPPPATAAEHVLSMCLLSYLNYEDEYEYHLRATNLQQCTMESRHQYNFLLPVSLTEDLYGKDSTSTVCPTITDKMPRKLAPPRGSTSRH